MQLIPGSVRDYSTAPCDKGCALKHAHVLKRDVVEVVVRPAMKYGDAIAGDRVIVDRHEMTIPAIAETLCTAKQYKALVDEEKRLAKKRATPPVRPADRVRGTIALQLDAATKRAQVERRGDRRFVQPEE